MKRSLTVLALLLLITGNIALIGTASARDASEGAAACRQGGWTDYVRADGTPFKNTGQCVRYVAQGGVLYPRLAPMVTITSVRFDGTYLYVDFIASGYEVNSPLDEYSYLIGADYLDFTDAAEYPPGFFTTDAMGIFDSGFAIGPGAGPYVCVEGTPGSVTITDAAGSTATGHFIVTCGGA